MPTVKNSMPFGRERLQEELEKIKVLIKNSGSSSVIISDLDVEEQVDDIGLFQSIFDIEKIQNIQDSFARATGVASIITNPHGDPITKPSNFCEFCFDVVRKTPLGLQNCLASDSEIGRYNPDGPIIQRCLSGGLYDAGASIMAGGKHIGNWLIGQVRDGTEHEEKFLDYASAIGADKEQFLSTLKKTSIMPLEKFKEIANALFLIANQLSSEAFLNLQLREKIKEVITSDEKYRMLIENSQEAMLLIRDGKYMFANSKAYSLLNCTDKDFLDQPILKFIHPDAHERVEKIYTRLMNGEKFKNIPPLKMITLSGSIVWIEIYPVLVDWGNSPALFVFALDISARKNFEQKLHTMYAAVEQNPTGIMLINKEDKIEYVNEMHSVITGFDSRDIIGQKISVLNFGIAESNLILENWDKFKIGECWKGEFENIKKNGDRYWEYCSISPIYDDDLNISHISFVREDITKRKNIEKQLISARDEAQRSNRLKSEFLAQMSHEIRTPVNTILSHLGLLRDAFYNSGDEDSRTSFNAVSSAGGRIIRTIDLLLNYSEIIVGAFKPDYTRINLAQVLEHFVDEFRETAVQKGLEIEFLPSDNHVWINGDTYSISKTLENIIDNSIKYTKSGKVTISLSKDSRGVRVNIEDTGVGISEDYLPFIFNPFSQEEQGYTRSFEGNGLGMALVKKYCEFNNADVSIQSEKNVGTNVTIFFPTQDAS